MKKKESESKFLHQRNAAKITEKPPSGTSNDASIRSRPGFLNNKL